jgi:hypothetical protein
VIYVIDNAAQEDRTDLPSIPKMRPLTTSLPATLRRLGESCHEGLEVLGYGSSRHPRVANRYFRGEIGGKAHRPIACPGALMDIRYANALENILGTIASCMHRLGFEFGVVLCLPDG